MMFKPPLFATKLRDICLRNPGNADVLTLAWEVKRLRATVLRADQFTKQIGTMGGIQGMMLESLRAALKDEPAVAEQAALTPDLSAR